MAALPRIALLVRLSSPVYVSRGPPTGLSGGLLICLSALECRGNAGVLNTSSRVVFSELLSGELGGDEGI